ncbi:MAG: hypothetical protein KA144_07080 [Xanthomonadaceae bacterium]|nr:hypothetical protein [Xanthomonadaceae bacterium]
MRKTGIGRVVGIVSVSRRRWHAAETAQTLSIRCAKRDEGRISAAFEAGCGVVTGRKYLSRDSTLLREPIFLTPAVVTDAVHAVRVSIALSAGAL